MRSCNRPRRSASPWMAATAQIRRPMRNRANFSSAARPCTRRAPARMLPRSGRQQLLDALGGGHLVDPLDRGVFAHEPIERGLVDLPLAIGLLGLTGVAEQVAHHLSDRGRI